jgi:serine/threonine protein kinase
MVSGPVVSRHIGRYEVLEELGRGAMGVVFKARDPFIGRMVAVKTITMGIAENPELLERFRREAVAAGGLQHPNIVTIYEMSESDGFPFIAMEYLEGDSIEKLISRQIPTPLAQKLGYIVQTCRALDYAHRRGVIHRDIKPANIMVTPEGVVKVVDFGIARITDSSKTQTGTLLGTVSYMSPEQLRGQHADQRSDIWSLGAVLYELLTGQRAFDGDNHAAIMMSILQNDPRGIAELITQCPPELENVVRRALQKDDRLRYQTMEALLLDLEPIWVSLQRETVQELVSRGRQLMESGKLAEAGEVLRQSLKIDTANGTAKALFEQVNASLGKNQNASQGTDRAGRSQDREKQPVPGPGRVGTDHGRDEPLHPTVRRDPQLTQYAGPASEKRPGSAAFAAQSPDARDNGRPTGSQAPLGNTGASKRSTGTVAAGQLPATVPAVVAQPRVPAGSRGAQPAISQPPRKQSGAYLVGGVVLALALGAFGYRRISDQHRPVATPSLSESTLEVAPVPDTAAASNAAPGTAAATAPVAAAPPPAPIVPAAQAVSPNTAQDAAPPSSASVEDQQRHLIDLAHEAADSHNYKGAQSRLDAAAKLNGPLNPLIDGLRRQFNAEARGTELQQAAGKEQTLWDQAMQDMAADHLDNADKALREILILPEGGRHMADAERYVDQVIPQQRHEDELWGQAQGQNSSSEPGHLINAVKYLDQLLAVGGIHQQDAKQMRDSVMKQFARNNARKNHETLQAAPIADQAKFYQLENQFLELVKRGDAQALQQLQALRPQFKTIAEAGGPLTMDARDYQNNVIPKAQKEIEDRLASAESAATANAAYEAAVKQYDQAVATQNTNALRSRVLPAFQQIVGSNSPRAPEAQRYVNALIPATLKAGAAH